MNSSVVLETENAPTSSPWEAAEVCNAGSVSESEPLMTRVQTTVAFVAKKTKSKSGTQTHDKSPSTASAPTHASGWGAGTPHACGLAEEGLAFVSVAEHSQSLCQSVHRSMRGGGRGTAGGGEWR